MVGQFANPDRQMDVEHVRTQLTQYGEDRICISEGQLFDKVALLVAAGESGPGLNSARR